LRTCKGKEFMAKAIVQKNTNQREPVPISSEIPSIFARARNQDARASSARRLIVMSPCINPGDALPVKALRS
jgi:hypothetical protein